MVVGVVLVPSSDTCSSIGARTDPSLRVLLVEDSQGLAESLQRGLCEAGFDVSHVSTAGKARRVLEESDGEEESPAVEASEKLRVAIRVIGPVTLAATVGGALLLSRRALSPLDSVIQGARKITASGLNQRLPLPKRRDELFTLVDELNCLLDRLESGFAA